MKQKKFLLVGGNGRESIFAEKLSAEGCAVYAVIPHANPTIIDCVERSGGKHLIGNPNNARTVTAFAQKQKIDYAFINSDEPLANGIVDALLKKNIKTIGGTKAATRLEWDKIYAMELMKKHLPAFTPFYRTATNLEELKNAIKEFRQQHKEIVVKPQGLTGGKGVKVMPIHLSTYKQCQQYGEQLLQQDGQVLLTERLIGKEFTIMAFTSGKQIALSPACYDYPYRYDGDTGPGTGGMGCYTNSKKSLPFMNKSHLSQCRRIMQTIIRALPDSTPFVGILNGGFFLTQTGKIQFMEFNARLGDPEAINVLSVLKTPLSTLLIKLWELSPLSQQQSRPPNPFSYSVKFPPKASVVKYLVEPSYPASGGTPQEFFLDTQKAKRHGISVYFSAAEKIHKTRYTTLGKSRVVALTATGQTPRKCADKINRFIKNKDCFSGNLEYRTDIGHIGK